MRKRKHSNQDLQDSPKDEEKLKQDKGELNLPDAEEIPGQENIHPPRFGEFADTTISSDDEEGKRIFGQDNSDLGSNVSRMERELLDKAQFTDPSDAETIEELALDSRDDDGEALNEDGMSEDMFGEDLDSPLIEEEDEENEAKANED